MASSRTLPTRITRRARARTRFGWARSERATVGLAAVALAGAGAVLVDQFGRLLARRAHERRSEEHLIGLAPAEAAKDTVAVAVRGYVAAPRSETVLFNLLAGSRPLRPGPPLDLGDPRRAGPSPQRQRRRPSHPPLRARHPDRLRLGHAVAHRRRRARAVRWRIPMGPASASPSTRRRRCSTCATSTGPAKGLLSVQLSLGATAILSIAILTLRMLRRGERRQEQEGLIPPSPPALFELARKVTEASIL